MNRIFVVVSTVLLLGACSSKPLPDCDVAQLKRPVAPHYPIEAAKNKIEGSVVMLFDINESGRPINIKVIEANPQKTFNKAAVKALSKWRYNPKVVNGEAIVQQDLKVTLDFTLDKK